MADISACNGQDCPIAEMCYRFTCKKDYYQSYSDFRYVNGDCDYFWDNGDKVRNAINDSTMS